MSENVEVFNTVGRPCLRPNTAHPDGLWPGGPFYMVGNAIIFHEQDAVAAQKDHATDRQWR